MINPYDTKKETGLERTLTIMASTTLTCANTTLINTLLSPAGLGSSGRRRRSSLVKLLQIWSEDIEAALGHAVQHEVPPVFAQNIHQFPEMVVAFLAQRERAVGDHLCFLQSQNKYSRLLSTKAILHRPCRYGGIGLQIYKVWSRKEQERKKA